MNSDRPQHSLDPLEPSGMRGLWLRRAAMLVGIVLVAAAVVLLWREKETVTEALRAIRQPAPGWLAVLLIGVAANVALTGLMFSLLMSRYGKVGVLEMQAVLAAASLLNYLPMRPGLFGRIAYHRAVNRIPAVNSAKTIVQASVLSIVLVAYVGTDVAISRVLDFSVWYGVAAPLPILLAGATIRGLRIWCLAALVRYVEVLVWSVRYYAAFRLVDSPIEPAGALAFASISMMATMLPFVSNGLGLREWAIGLTAPYLTSYQLELGITAELVNRAGELVMVLILGLMGVAFLAHRRRETGGVE